MAGFASLFSHQLAFDPAGSLESFLKAAPAKPVVYLLADEQDQPVQLLSVRNLRASLKRRLSSDDSATPSRRVPYRELVRRIYYLRVDSYFEADLAYLEAARMIFPQTYQALAAQRQALFVQVDPDAAFPRLVKTPDPAATAGVVLGPFEDKHAAARFIEEVENAFDLCRYYATLTQAPHARACPYKEMGRCDAPCDGSVTMESYRRRVQLAVRGAVRPEEEVERQTQAMQQAARELQFEQAARIKASIGRLKHLGKGSFRHARLVSELCLVSLQPGPRPGTAKVFLITPGWIEPLAGLIGDPGPASELRRWALERTAALLAGHKPSGEVLSLLSRHLFSPRTLASAFMRLDRLDEKVMAASYRAAQKHKRAEESDEEGVQEELAAI